MQSRILKSDFTGLNNIVKALSDKHVVKVGILGRKTNRKGDNGLTNAELGAIHEFGSYTKHIEKRSFLRMPIHKKQDEIAGEAATASTDLAKEGNMIGILRNIGLACESAIQQAFASRGFGEWKPDSPSTIRGKSKGKKVEDSPLIDTGQLRRSITSKVDKPS